MKFISLTQVHETARMPFAEYEGQLIKDLPTSYLCWLIRTDAPILICLSAYAELGRRRNEDTSWEEHACVMAIQLEESHNEEEEA